MENRQTENIQTENQILQLVSFNIGNEEYAVDILKVQEINRMISITQIPNSPNFVEGVINLRGRVIPVISLRKKLGFTSKEIDNNSRIIVVEVNNKTIGFIVDGVSEVLRIPNSITENLPEITSKVNSKYITSIAKFDDRLIILLDLDKIISDEELQKV